jgi:hypothetical protein
MKKQRSVVAEEEHRVLKFRPRNSLELTDYWTKVAGPADETHEPNSLSRYDQKRDEPDDFRHRMIANLAALAFTVALTAVGIWLAMSIADLRNTQDCVLMGRRDCAHISVPRT